MRHFFKLRSPLPPCKNKCEHGHKELKSCFHKQLFSKLLPHNAQSQQLEIDELGRKIIWSIKKKRGGGNLKSYHFPTFFDNVSRLKKVLGGHNDIGNMSVRRLARASYAWKFEKVGSLGFSNFDQAVNRTRAFTAVVTTGARTGDAATRYNFISILITIAVWRLRISVD